MIKHTEKFPIVLTTRKENLPKDYAILHTLKTGEVIAIDREFANFLDSKQDLQVA